MQKLNKFVVILLACILTQYVHVTMQLCRSSALYNKHKSVSHEFWAKFKHIVMELTETLFWAVQLQPHNTQHAIISNSQKFFSPNPATTALWKYTCITQYIFGHAVNIAIGPMQSLTQEQGGGGKKKR